ncbi:MAG: O-antigen ligase family protein [Cyclobacteriaceae bacterium]|nr:O-antigen ligase family protein [Cyclobacteriaceae bacterium]
MQLKSTLISNLLQWAFCLAYVGLLFPIPISNVTLIVLGLVALSTFKKGNFFNRLPQNRPAILLILFFVLHVVSLIYTFNLSNGLFNLEKKLSFFILPIILVPAFSHMDLSERQALNNKIGLLTILIGLTLLSFACVKYFFLHDSLAFDKDYFAPISYVFFGMQFTVGSLIMINRWLEKTNNGLYDLLVVIMLFSFFLLILFINSSRIGIVSFAIGSVFLLFLKLRNKKAALITLSVLLIAICALLLIFKTTRDRFTELTHNLEMIQLEKLEEYQEFNGLNLRLYLWKVSLSHLWQDRLLLYGVGAGDEPDYLAKAYKVHNLDEYGFDGFDPHNQWVSTCLHLGLIGVAFMGAMFLVGTKQSFQTMNYNLLVFLLVTFSYCTTESIFESNKGIVFFSLFLSLIGIRSKTLH